MSKDLIGICDLTHTATGSYATNLMPYPIASIKSYLMHFSEYKDDFEVKIFKDPKKFIEWYLSNKPKIVGFSNYVWNKELSCELAREIKSKDSDTLIIFGGPNFPLDDPSREKWLKQHTEVDLYIIGEAEESFTKIIDIWHKTRDLNTIKTTDVIGCFAIVNDKLFKSSEFSPRIPKLDSIPSPYLEGYLDEFLSDSKLSPLLESNRGCPFTCTFCVDGIKDRSRVYYKEVSRFEKELEYIATHYEGKVLTLADLNFGMYNQDIEISNAIANIKEKFNYPYYIQVSTGKNNKPKVLKCAEILKGSMSLAASVQSLDKEVLTKIKRKNIQEDQLLDMTKAGNKMSANTYSEVILALPGDSKEKHMDTVLKLADSDMNLISMYQCMILEGSEMGSKSSRDQWKMGTKFRVLPKCYGVYNFDGKEILCAEIEEICVTTESLPIEDYYECRLFALTEGLFYQDRVLVEMYRFLENFGIKASDVLRQLHKNKEKFSEKLLALYASFDNDTRTELWDSKDELREFIKSDRTVIDRYYKGELGKNVLFRHRAIAALELSDSIHDEVFKIIEEMLKIKNNHVYLQYKDYLNELKEFSKLRKRNVFDYEKQYESEFNYDFKTLMEKDFEILPQRLEKSVKVRFFTNDEKKLMIKEQIAERGSDVDGIGKILSRTLGSMLLRNVEFENIAYEQSKKEKMVKEIGILEKDVGINQSPGEFV
tara:strand:+ start:26011 stop:28140 length:2130 start_codon:yes stop_codon:yes gene_type:complete